MTADDLTPEERLRRRLHAELGDPDAPDPGGGARPPAGWVAIEHGAEQRAMRTRLLVGIAASVLVVALLTGVLALRSHGPGQPSVTDAAGIVVDQTTGTAPGSTSTASSGDGGTSTDATGTTASTPSGPGPSTSMPDPPTTTLPAGSTLPEQTTTTDTTGDGQLDCGTRYLASGWPTTTAPARNFADCILGAFETGTPAIYRERAQTDGSGGHIEITTYEVIGVQRVRRTVDATGAEPPGGVTVTVCTGLGHDGQVVVPTGCA